MGGHPAGLVHPNSLGIDILSVDALKRINLHLREEKREEAIQWIEQSKERAKKYSQVLFFKRTVTIYVRYIVIVASNYICCVLLRNTKDSLLIMSISLDDFLETRKKWILPSANVRKRWNDESIDMQNSKEDVADVTVVIPIHSSVFLAEHAYTQAKEVLLLCNGNASINSSHARILNVAWQGHAQTRKEAVRHITTKYTFFSVQDAFPTRDMLRSLIEEMELGDWDILIPRQIPWPDSNDIDIQRIKKWTPDRNHVFSMPHADHVGSLYRSEDLRQWNLADVPIAEDVWWSRGRRVGCVPWAKIIHSHPFSVSALFQRERAIHAQLHSLGLLNPPSWTSMLGVFFAKKGRRRRVLVESVGQFMGWVER